jgi:hypothetical protein
MEEIQSNMQNKNPRKRDSIQIILEKLKIRTIY